MNEISPISKPANRDDSVISTRTGILLVNLGSPDEPTPIAVRKYLAEFLSDPYVVNAPRVFWWIVLHGIILRVRPPKTALAYQKIWTDDGSPLISISYRQLQKLQPLCSVEISNDITIELAMRYGTPSIQEALQHLKNKRITTLVVLPLYPQYSTTTTKSVFEKVSKSITKLKWSPSTIYINNYHEHPKYINAIANSVKTYWDINQRSDKLLISFHGLPKESINRGDPYYYQCKKTAELVANELDLSKSEWLLVFQSRFGKTEWLQPYCDKTLLELAANKVSRVDVVCPGFSADCLETLEEMNMQNRSLFLDAGGKEFHYIPALNETTEHMSALLSIVKNALDI